MRLNTGLCTEDIWSSMSLNQSSLNFMVRFLQIIALVCRPVSCFSFTVVRKELPTKNVLIDSRGSTKHYFQVDLHIRSQRNGHIASVRDSFWKLQYSYFSVKISESLFFESFSQWSLLWNLSPSVGSFPDAQLPSKRIIGPKNYEFLTSKREEFQEYLQVDVWEDRPFKSWPLDFIRQRQSILWWVSKGARIWQHETSDYVILQRAEDYSNTQL